MQHLASPVVARPSCQTLGLATRHTMRYIVVGTSGSGKSTFARALGSTLHSPYVELDNLHWGPNWTPRSRGEFEQAVREATSGNGWVVDGNYSAVQHTFWPNAT